VKVEQYEGGRTDQEILIGMCVDPAVLGAVAARWDGKLFSSSWANRVAGWCVKHYAAYRKAPNKLVGAYFDRWAEAGRRDEQETRRMEEFLQHLEGQYHRNGRGPDPRYVVDLAARRFTAVRLKDRCERALAVVDEDVDKAVAEFEAFRPVEVGAGAGVDVLTDREAVSRAFRRRGEVVIRFNQPALDRFFGHALAKEEFVVFLGREKVGKSFWLQELALLGAEQGKNIAFFECGDQSEGQLTRRIAARVARHPHTLEDDRPALWPTALDAGRPPAVTHEELRFDAPLTEGQAWKAFRRFTKKAGAGSLKLSCHPADTISIAGIESTLDAWARDGWLADAVIIDYLDIVAPLNGRAETRDQINATWKGCRKLSVKYHCLLVSATQSNRDGYDAETLDMSNVSEDKRKNSHVTGMVAINRTQAEEDAGLFRLTWPALRDQDFSKKQGLYTAACLAVCHPCVLSTF
jgi:hypothetical protein